MELSTKQTNEKNEKVRALSAEIVVHGSVEKPYYEIEYYDLSDGQYHTGYSSYDLNNVFRWREECFEIVKESEHDMISKQVKELREMSQQYPVNISIDLFERTLNQAADTIESLSAKLQAANMERSADCGGWIPCKERLPEEDNDFVVTFRDGECVIAYLDDNDKWINSSTGAEISLLVVAWQPLPEPYHEP